VIDELTIESNGERPVFGAMGGNAHDFSAARPKTGAHLSGVIESGRADNFWVGALGIDSTTGERRS
jgi:hypothetical protein